jgi:hypothetical protein
MRGKEWARKRRIIIRFEWRSSARLHVMVAASAWRESDARRQCGSARAYAEIRRFWLSERLGSL